ncbi:helix-turn-helix domain-containing protein [Neobacillus dielmonensis]|uniref:helix-turn-helix domain-containing protein n=1 Tax=Neobacillus dielmonensis TaxID=1347369 RepID=UPI0005AAA4F8|nr:helix-turn-helix domain-containing protein [Neobacillus dielmonensis]
MEFGALIKYYRTQKGITQAELAKGICSVPHLSKIENNSKEANKDTIGLLLDRLNVSLEEIEEKEGEIQSLLGLFNEKLNYFLINEIDEIYHKLQEMEHIIPFSKYIYTYELYKYRYLLFKGFLTEAEAQKDLLYKQKKNFSQHEEYLFHYYNAVCLILRNHYKEADEILESLYSDSHYESLSGEFLYHRALVKVSLDQSGHAIHFGKMALEIYSNQYNFIRILHTLMLLGISYTHSNIYEEALECYRHLIRNAEILKEERLLPQIYNNMGHLQSKLNHYKEALYYFEKSISLQSEVNEHYVATLYSIGELHYFNEKLDKAIACFQQVHLLSKELKVRKFYLLSEFYLLNVNSQDKAIRYLELKVIPYFEEVKEYKDYLIKFYKMLAEHYAQKGMAHAAVKYLHKIT